MALTYGFYNSIADDRTYDAIQVSKLFDGMINDGVYATYENYLLVVSPSPGMEIHVKSGRAWFNHTWTLNDSDYPLNVSFGDPLYPRYDAVILEINQNVGVRENTIQIIEGIPSTNPVYPTLENTSVVHQYALAYIYVKAAATSISQSNIINNIGTSGCPFVTGLLSYVTTDQLIQQWEAEFEYWFEYIMGELDSEVAGNLQSQIIAMRGDLNPPLITLLELKTHDHNGGDGNQIPTGGILDNAVDDSKIGNRVIQLNRRVGGDSQSWAIEGNTTYTPGYIRGQVGSRLADSSIDVVTFPVSYSYSPLVFLQITDINVYRAIVTARSPTGFTVRLFNQAGAGVVGTYEWIALGTE